jgi:hypothetical protein
MTSHTPSPKRLAVSAVLLGIFTTSLSGQFSGQGGYTGPAVLSRPAASRLGGQTPYTFRPYVGVTGMYETGLTGVSIDQHGNPPNIDVYSAGINFGASTAHSWRKTSLLFDYRGNFYHRFGKSFYDGTSHFLTLGVAHQATKRIEVFAGVTGGTFSRGYNYGNPTVNNPAFSVSPTVSIFDNQSYFYTSQAGVIYQKSARLSFSASGGYALQHYRSSALIGQETLGAIGDVAYRWSRVTTIGVAYGFGHFRFTQRFGTTDYHQALVFWSRQLSRGWQIGIGAGGLRAESLFLATVPVDPVIAAITGQSTGQIAAYAVNYGWVGRASLLYHARRSTTQMYYQRGLAPGNGVYLTSWQESVGVTYSYTGVRHWNLGLDGTYIRMKAFLQNMAPYTGYSAGAGASRDIVRNWLYFSTNVYARRYDTGPTFKRDAWGVIIGLYFSPGEVPLKFW